jgi:FtsH-binding integral membrane protein
MDYSEVFNRERPVPAITSYDTQVRPLLKWVYAWMGIGLLVTAIIAFITATSPGLLELRTNPIIAIGSFVLMIAFVLGLSWGISRISPSVAALLFMLYAGLMGFSLSMVVLFFDLGSIFIAFGTTAVLFGVMSMFGFTTTVDLTQYRNLLFMALIGLLVAIVLNMFFGGGVFTLIISIVGVIIFMGLTAYDTQNIKRMAVVLEQEGDAAAVAKYSIFGALSLYLNFINIFIFLLQIMGGNSE